MKKIITAALILVALCICATPVTAFSYGTASGISITTIEKNPEVLMSGDTGTITFTVKNNGNGTVTIDHADMFGYGLQVLNPDTYDSSLTIGEKNSAQFSFNVRAPAEEGTYFPKFYMDYMENGAGSGGSMSYPFAMEVDCTEPSVYVVDAPNSYAAGESETITLCVGNDRTDEISSITVTPTGSGFTSLETGQFIGNLEPDEYAEVTFDITPLEETEVIFEIEYRNGNNRHTSMIALPITFSEDKLKAEPLVNAIEVSNAGGSYTLKGDISNAGLTDAKSVVVTVESPADPCDPNPVYMVGALEPDDFSSFELTFIARNAGTVPMSIQYKDEDGNKFEEIYSINLNGTASGNGSMPDGEMVIPEGGGRGGGMMGGFGSGMGKIPVTEIFMVLIVGVGAVVSWRKGWLNRDTLAKIKEEARKRLRR